MEKRPEYCEDWHLEYLDGLRSTMSNMWSAGVYLRKQFKELNAEKSSRILAYWMQTVGHEER